MISLDPDTMRELYYLLLIELGVGILEADEGARGLVARDCSDRWWEQIQ